MIFNNRIKSIEFINWVVYIQYCMMNQEILKVFIKTWFLWNSWLMNVSLTTRNRFIQTILFVKFKPHFIVSKSVKYSSTKKSFHLQRLHAHKTTKSAGSQVIMTSIICMFGKLTRAKSIILLLHSVDLNWIETRILFTDFQNKPRPQANQFSL